MRLLPSHRECFKVENLLVADAVALDPEEIEAICEGYLQGDRSRDDAVMAFASCVRHITGRWLAAFRATRSMEDDLVSVAMETVIHSIDSLTTAEDATNIITNRVLRAQTEHINDYRSASAPSLRTQQRKRVSGEEVQYTDQIEDTYDKEDDHDYNAHIDLIDDAYKVAEDDLDLAILSCKGALNNREVADRLGIPQTTVRRRRARLYEELKKLIDPEKE